MSDELAPRTLCDIISPVVVASIDGWPPDELGADTTYLVRLAQRHKEDSMSVTADDRWSITEVLARFGDAADNRDFESLRDVFTDDATTDFGPADAHEGVTAIVAAVGDTLAHTDSTQHLNGVSIITESGTGAHARTRFIATHVRAGVEGDPIFTVAGTYDDDLVTVPAGWRIAHRKITVTWVSGNPAVLELG
jgi:ketosteroid isomerase-like protein